MRRRGRHTIERLKHPRAISLIRSDGRWGRVCGIYAHAVVIPESPATLHTIESAGIGGGRDNRVRRIGGRWPYTEDSWRGDMGTIRRVPLATMGVRVDFEGLVGPEELGEQEGATFLISAS